MCNTPAVGMPLAATVTIDGSDSRMSHFDEKAKAWDEDLRRVTASAGYRIRLNK